MKKYIIAIAGLAFTLQMTAQKVFVIHKKDGSTIEMPIGSKIHFTGKAKVNDNEYVRITNIKQNQSYSQNGVSTIMPVLSFDIDCSGLKEFGNYDMNKETTSYGYEIEGICSSVTPARNNQYLYPTMIAMNSNGNPMLAFNTTYNITAYIEHNGQRYNSSTVSINTGLPPMQYYGYNLGNIADYAETGYVYPSKEAIDALFTKYTNEFACNDEAFRNKLFTSCWGKYLTIEKAKELKAKCNENKLDCLEGTIYLLDEIDDNFMAMFDNVEVNLRGDEGILETFSAGYSKMDTVACDASFGVPNNTYYEFIGNINFMSPRIIYLIDTPLLAGRTYEVQIVLAPDPMQNLFVMYHLNGNLSTEKGKYSSDILYWDYETKANTCEVVTLSFTPKQFGENAIQVEAQSFIDLVKYTNNTRIAAIKVKSVK